jgi:hypothetical protein
LGLVRAISVKVCRLLTNIPYRTSKKARTSDVHGIDEDWNDVINKRAERTKGTQLSSTPVITAEPNKDDDAMVQFGGLAADHESDVEAKALASNPSHLVLGLKKPKKLYVEC